MIMRWFIADGHIDVLGSGDGRTFSSDISASARFTVAWDTDSGTLTMIDQPSCVAGDCIHAHPTGQGNNLTNVATHTGDDGSTTVRFSYQGRDAVPVAAYFIGDISGDLSLSTQANGTSTSRSVTAPPSRPWSLTSTSQANRRER